MRFADFFTGIGGFRIALASAGHECVYSCEWDPFCRKVLKARFGREPEGKDINEIKPKEIPDADLWCAGPPCVDLSVAGRRAGLRAPRSGLFYRFVELLAAKRPRHVLLEQVPGLFSSHEGRDMEAWLGSLAELGYMGTYWVLDAQFRGVPQRRRRVLTWGTLGGAGFEQIFPFAESCPRHSPQGRAEREDAAALFGGRAQVVGCLGGRGNGGPDDNDAQGGHLIVEGDSAASTPKLPRLRAGCGRAGETNIATSIQASAGHHGHSSPRGDGSDNLVAVGIDGKDKAHAVSKSSGGGLGGRDGQDDYVIQDVRGGTRDKTDQGQGIEIRNDGKCYTLDATSQHAVATPDVAGTIKQRMRGATDEVMDSLVAAPLSAGSNPNSNAAGRRREDDENIVLTLRADQGGANQAPAKADGKSDALGTTGQQGIAIKENQGDPQLGDPSRSQNPITLAIRGRGDSHDLEYRQDGTSNAVLTPSGGRAGIGVGAVAFMKTNHTKSTQYPIKTDGKTDRVDTTGQAVVAFDPTQITSKENRCNPQPGDPSHPLASQAHPPVIVQSPAQEAMAFDCKAGGDTTFSIGSKPGSLRGEGHGGGHTAVVAPVGMSIRRLTPTECERLMGQSDGHTCICGVRPDCPDRRIPPWIDRSKVKLDGCGHSACGCKCSDGPRYKVCGNSVVVPVIRWVAERLPK